MARMTAMAREKVGGMNLFHIVAQTPSVPVSTPSGFPSGKPVVSKSLKSSLFWRKESKSKLSRTSPFSRGPKSMRYCPYMERLARTLRMNRFPKMTMLLFGDCSLERQVTTYVSVVDVKLGHDIDIRLLRCKARCWGSRRSWLGYSWLRNRVRFLSSIKGIRMLGNGWCCWRRGWWSLRFSRGCRSHACR